MPLGNLQNLRQFKSVGGGKYKACCPAHDDKGPSLAIRELDDGRILIHCFAGCSVDEILGAAGMEIQELMPEQIDGHRHRPVSPSHNPSLGLKQLSIETMIVIDCARQIHAGLRLNKIDRERLERAWNKVAEISAICG